MDTGGATRVADGAQSAAAPTVHISQTPGNVSRVIYLKLE